MCQANRRPPSVSPLSQPAVTAGESHTGREKSNSQDKVHYAMRPFPLKMRTPFGERRWFSGQSACLLAARLGIIEQASQWLFIKKEICHPGSTSLNSLQQNGETCLVHDTFGMWKTPKLFVGRVKIAHNLKY